jgi:(4-O-methyl)-D-glucuronate---lignin esterase
MDLLHITALRPGADPNHADAANAVNYDESKANRYPALPNPLVMRNGEKVRTAEMWWKERRPEIVEGFDREVYGRFPRVDWQVASEAKMRWAACR